MIWPWEEGRGFACSLEGLLGRAAFCSKEWRVGPGGVPWDLNRAFLHKIQGAGGLVGVGVGLVGLLVEWVLSFSSSYLSQTGGRRLLTFLGGLKITTSVQKTLVLSSFARFNH